MFAENGSFELDKLTGVLTRNSIQNYISQLMADDRKFCLCIFDIDNFKFINDTYGHLVGDEVLIAMSEFIVSKINDKTVIGRFGGDEFMIVFEDLQEYDEIWKACFDLHHELRFNTFSEICGVDITITMGIGRYPLDAHTMEELFLIADKALYRGKTKGRNCYIIYIPEKHAHLVLEENKEVKISSTFLLSKCLSILKDEKKEYSKRVKTLFKFIKTQFTLDHICFQNKEKVVCSIVDKNSKHKQFDFIPHEILWNEMNVMGYYTLNRHGKPEIVAPKALQVADEQRIRGQIAVKVEEKGEALGIIRCEMSQGDRIWQQAEITLLLTIAAVLAKDLYYQKIEF